MRILLATLLLVPTLAWAEAFQTDKPTVCDDIPKIMKHMQEKYNEIPVWHGRGTGSIDNGSSLVLLMNHSTKTWTIVQYNDKVACILGTGDDTQFTPDALGEKI